jgi:glyoxylase-like metal-dependent hydrolase (beta-lactamase superfamily II)
MNIDNYHFNIGSYKCMAISDGTMTYSPPTFPHPVNFLFANADKEKLEKALKDYGIGLTEWTEWISSYTCLFINTGKYKVLVDTGADGLSPNTGRLQINLKKEGIAPEDIDIVILTHAHPDHIGGNINTEGKPVYPNARWVIWRDEWQFWISDQSEKQLAEHSREMLIGIARKNLLPLEKQIDLIDGEIEIIPGIRAIAAPGHTPGLIALSVTSEGDQLLCISDVVIHPIHLAEPEWFTATDVLPDKVYATRNKLLKKATLEKSLVMAFHFPFPGLGHVLQNDKVWQWQSIEEKIR